MHLLRVYFALRFAEGNAKHRADEDRADRDETRFHRGEHHFNCLIRMFLRAFASPTADSVRLGKFTFWHAPHTQLPSGAGVWMAGFEGGAADVAGGRVAGGAPASTSWV